MKKLKRSWENNQLLIYRKENMTKITKLSNIIIGQEYEANIVIDKILSEGDSSTRKPISFSCRIEESGSILKLSSWQYSDLELYKKLIETHTICELTFFSKMYKDVPSFSVVRLLETEKVSNLPVKNIKQEYFKKEITDLVNLVKDKDYKNLLTKLVLNNANYFEWPAAYSVHHAFPGGLALHSFSVTEISLKIAETYSYSNIDKDIIITGALLHDIGKLKEYTSSGNFSFAGTFLSHLVIGIEMIDDACKELNINSDDNKILFIKHIIASHHGKLEFGSPVPPKTIEAQIISQADNADSKIESIQEALELSTDNEKEIFTAPIKALENSKVYIPRKK